MLQEITVRHILFVRTVVDSILFPVWSQAFGSVLSKNDFSRIFVQAFPFLIKSALAKFDGGQPGDATKILMDGVTNDLLDPKGNFSTILAKTIGPEIVASLTVKYGSKVVPVLGEISLLIDAANTASNAYGVGVTIGYLVETPATLAYSVDWNLQIIDYEPTEYQRHKESVFGTEVFRVYGVDFQDIDQLVLVDDGRPGSSFSTSVAEGYSPHVVYGDWAATFLIDKDFIDRAVGPLRVVLKGKDGQTDEHSQKLNLTGCEPILLDRYRMIGSNDAPDVESDCSIVRDMESHLEWQRCSAGQSWDNATKKCVGNPWLRYRPGYWVTLPPYNVPSFMDGVPSGWRLPNASELRTLVYCSSGVPVLVNMTFDDTACGVGSTLPTILSAAFPNTYIGGYWTLTPSATAEDFWWVARFDLGKVYDGGYNLPYAMRYVRDASK